MYLVSPLHGMQNLLEVKTRRGEIGTAFAVGFNKHDRHRSTLLPKREGFRFLSAALTAQLQRTNERTSPLIFAPSCDVRRGARALSMLGNSSARVPKPRHPSEHAIKREGGRMSRTTGGGRAREKWSVKEVTALRGREKSRWHSFVPTNWR